MPNKETLAQCNLYSTTTQKHRHTKIGFGNSTFGGNCLAYLPSAHCEVIGSVYARAGFKAKRAMQVDTNSQKYCTFCAASILIRIMFPKATMMSGSF
eukprot:4779919-Amphidinium_carterae.1